MRYLKYPLVGATVVVLPLALLSLITQLFGDNVTGALIGFAIFVGFATAIGSVVINCWELWRGR